MLVRVFIFGEVHFKVTWYGHGWVTWYGLCVVDTPTWWRKKNGHVQHTNTYPKNYYSQCYKRKTRQRLLNKILKDFPSNESEPQTTKWSFPPLKKKKKEEEEEKNVKPGQVAIFWLPTPLRMKIIRPTILRAPETVVQERTICGQIQWVALIPNPIPIKHITLITAHIKKSKPSIYRTWWRWWWILWKRATKSQPR